MRPLFFILILLIPNISSALANNGHTNYKSYGTLDTRIESTHQSNPSSAVRNEPRSWLIRPLRLVSVLLLNSAVRLCTHVMDILITCVRMVVPIGVFVLLPLLLYSLLHIIVYFPYFESYSIL